MHNKYIIFSFFLFCACNSDRKEDTEVDSDDIEIVEVYDKTVQMLDEYDSIQDKWICNHEGTFEEICNIHDIDPQDTHLWIFKKLKNDN